MSTKFTLPVRLYLTADKERVVEAGDPEAAFLLGPAGREIPIEEAKKYGLLDLQIDADDEGDEAQEAGESEAEASADAGYPDKLAELKEIAAERGLEEAEDMRSKKEVLALLEADDAAQAEAEADDEGDEAQEAGESEDE